MANWKEVLTEISEEEQKFIAEGKQDNAKGLALDKIRRKYLKEVSVKTKSYDFI